MDTPLNPAEADALDMLPLELLAGLVRSWRNHWAEVERITSDFPQDIKQVLVLRPADTNEALEQTVAQFAVLFNPQATAGFVALLNATLRTVEALMKDAASTNGS